MKARKIKRLDPAGRLDENARRILALRSSELLGLAQRAREPADVEALHDLRIAAKRLRYVLELVGPAAIGPRSRTLSRQAKELQELLGEIHDCDMQLPELRALSRELPERSAKGIRTLAVRFATRRAELFERFHATWPRYERSFTRLSHDAGDRRVDLGS